MALLAPVSEESEEPLKNCAGFKKSYITSKNKSKFTFWLEILHIICYFTSHKL